MNSIPKKHIRLFNRYYSAVLTIVCIIWATPLHAQQEMEWGNIHLTDTETYTSFSTDHICNKKYPPENAFDAAFDTCWVSGTGMDTSPSPLYCKLPSLDTMTLNIFSGYGKNNLLYTQNGRPREIRLTLYAAVRPEGYISETGALYRTVIFPQRQTVLLEDRFGVQSVPLNFEKKSLSEFKKKVQKQYQKKYSPPAADTCFILKIDIQDIFPGTKYKDICISEIYFNDCFIPVRQVPSPRIQRVYLNRDENTLLLDDRTVKGIIAYCDHSSVLQILEVSKNRDWAILISMPADIQGRMETSCLLVDLFNKTVINSQLEEITGTSQMGNSLYFKTGKDGRLYVMYSNNDGKEHGIELR